MKSKIFPDEWLHRFGHDRVGVIERYGDTWRVVIGLSTVATGVMGRDEAMAIAERAVARDRADGG